MKNFLPCVIVGFLLFAFSGCKKDSGMGITPAEKTPDPTVATPAVVAVAPPVSSNKVSPDGFTFTTTKNVVVNLTVLSAAGDAAKGVIVKFYNPEDLSFTSSAIYTGVTDNAGKIRAEITVPAFLKTLVIDPAGSSLPHLATANIGDFNLINAVIGGPAVFSGDIVKIGSVASVNSLGKRINIIESGQDSDNDGVPDLSDDFPYDATRTGTYYYPSKTGYAQIGFEDNWPTKGDYDMNDLVVNYRYAFNFNSQNKVVDMGIEVNCAAVGASFRNGFGIQIPVESGAVTLVTGQKLIGNYITLNNNGTEAGQTQAVVIPFDNTDAIIRNPGDAYFVNTLTDKPKVTDGLTLSLKVIFKSPIAIEQLVVTKFNPFLISNQRRGYEVHLPGYAATDLASNSLFNAGDDNYAVTPYTSKDNWPWAMSFNSDFTYPVERESIGTAYLHFYDWAKSGGQAFKDWYVNAGAGYRNTVYIYKK